MDNMKFLALMGDEGTNFTLAVSSANLRAFARQLIEMARTELAEKKQSDEQQKKDEETFFSRKQAAEYLGICETTLWKWAKPDVAYLVPVKVGGKVRYTKSQLDRIKFGGKKGESKTDTPKNGMPGYAAVPVIV